MYVPEKKVIQVVMDGCVISCQGCGLEKVHREKLEQALDHYTGGKCPSCGSADVYGEDREVPPPDFIDVEKLTGMTFAQAAQGDGA